jgi:ABC-type multidrug transport system fused ATPase/permease subunit
MTAHKEQLKTEMCGDLPYDDSIERSLADFSKHYESYLAADKSPNALLKAIFRTFMSELLWQLLLNTVVATLTFASPIIV